MPARDLDAFTEETESESALYACAICGRQREAHSVFLTTGLLCCESLACRKRARTLDADYPAPKPSRRPTLRPAPAAALPAVPRAAPHAGEGHAHVVVSVVQRRGPFVPPPMNAHALLVNARAEAAVACDTCGHARSAHRGRSCLAADGLCQCGGFTSD